MIDEQLILAIGRQIAHIKAKTDGGSPYYAGNEWNPDLWRMDNELIVADYLKRYLSQWEIAVPCPTCDGTGEVHSHNPRCPSCSGKKTVPVAQRPPER